jgi:small subunit ribosomal protein S5
MQRAKLALTSKPVWRNSVAVRISSEDLELEERVVQINRVAKVVKGGRRFSFSTVVVVGDGKGHVGIGMGKASEVPEAIRKGAEAAKKNLIRVPLVNTTIPHEVLTKFAATKVMLRPAAPGTGVIAGRGVRPVVEAAGIKDLLTKVYGSNNPVNVVKAAYQALGELVSLSEMARRRDMAPQELAQRRALREASNQETSS